MPRLPSSNSFRERLMSPGRPSRTCAATPIEDEDANLATVDAARACAPRIALTQPVTATTVAPQSARAAPALVELPLEAGVAACEEHGPEALREPFIALVRLERLEHPRGDDR